MPRDRATAIVLRDSRVLLVREKHAKRYSLPGEGVSSRDELTVRRRPWWLQLWQKIFGGGVNREAAKTAVIREVLEETGLTADNVEWKFRHGRHWVFSMHIPQGVVHLQAKEISNFNWWDGKDQIRATGTTRKILNRCGF